jgi:ATP-binding cassette subfamily F protein 3
MLQLDNITLRRGSDDLLTGASLAVHDGQKMGIVGANGTGKSSLFALIRGELETAGGSVRLPKHWRLAWMAQEVPGLQQPALDYVLDGDEELREVEAGLREAEASGDGERLGELHGRLHAIDGYAAHARAARLLHTLGFNPGDEHQPVAHFSGGWRIRLNLARTLLSRADLLLLDEPTNHLDLDAVIRLQDWLVAYPGTLLLISHDRDFLDAVVGHIVHFKNSQLTVYPGGYSAFEDQYAEQQRLQQAAYEKQQAEIARINQFVERFRAKANKATLAQSRLKALERMERVAPAHAETPFQFSFPEPDKLPNPLLTLKNARLGYDGQAIVSGVNLELRPGDRMALLGPNGAGKSTVIKALAGQLAPLAGERQGAQHLRVGYFAQHQVDTLDPEASPLLHLERLDPSAHLQQLRNFLGGFGFRGEGADSPVAPFSGGEKARLALALIVYQRPNLLLLDEPTNHLDLEMRHALTVALQEFSGALVTISHDRHLLRSVADRMWLVADGGLDAFEDDLEGYRRWLLERGTDGPSVPPQQGQGGGKKGAGKERRQAGAEQRQALKPLRQELRRLEKEIDRLSARKAELDEALADPGLYGDAGREEERERLLREHGQVAKELEEAEEAWMAAQDQLEAAQQA